MKRNFIECSLILACILLFNACGNSFESDDMIKESKELNLLDDGYSIKVDLFEDYRFLEHVTSLSESNSTEKIIITKRATGNLYVSDDLGETFRKVYSSGAENWGGCFTLKNGTHLLWEKNTLMIWVFDKNWKLIEKVKNGDFPWHGSWSIGEQNGFIMYSEYAGNEEKYRVWRSEDGLDWEEVFAQKGRVSDDPQIRHFHTCQPDPFSSTDWYVSSGDASYECFVWKSNDNGETWNNVSDPNYVDFNQSIFRYTAIYFDQENIYWGTDDMMGDYPVLVRSRKTKPLELEIIGEFGNVIRNATLTDYGLVFLSETGGVKDGKILDFCIDILDENQNLISLYKEEGTNEEKNGFVSSLGSLYAKNNVFFSYANGQAVFIDRPGMIRWTITKK